MAGKKIFIIERSQDVFQTVKTYLQEDSLEFLSFQSVAEALASPELAALIILFGSNDINEIKNDLSELKNSPAFTRLPKILILPFNSGISSAAVSTLDMQEIFQVPVEKLKFQTVISRFLHRSPRRVFRILVSIQQDGSKIRYSGLSMDFSESGMAFECVGDFHVNEDLMISFVNPKNRQRLALKAEVVRKTAPLSGDSTFYGVMFKEIAGKATDELSDFISGKA